MHCFAVASDSELVSRSNNDQSDITRETVILILAVDANFTGSIAMVGNLVTYNKTGSNHTTTVFNSLIGTPSLDAPDQLWLDFVEISYLNPLVTQLGTTGLSIPTMAGVTFVNAEVTFLSGVIQVASVPAMVSSKRQRRRLQGEL